MMNYPTVIADGRIGRDAALRWFLWHPLRRGSWRWPRIERMGQFGRYTYRFQIGPVDGKWRNHAPPERTRLR